MTDQRSIFRADLALLTVALIWGLNFPVMKTALQEVHPFAFNSVRITLSAVFLGVLHLRLRPKVPVPREVWLKIFGLSMLGYFVYQIVFLLGLARTTAGNSSLLLASAPIWSALLLRLLGDRLRGLAWLGLAMAFAGTTSIATAHGDVEFGGASMLGNALSIGAAMAWGSYTTLNRSVASVVSPASLAFYTTAVTLPLHWLIAAPYYHEFAAVEHPARVWGAVFYAGVFGTGVAYVLWNVGIRYVGSAQTAIYVNLSPVIAVVTSYFWLGESIRLTHVLGGALILGGLWVMRLARVNRPASADR